MTRTAAVVVIGGGITGASTAYHLVKRGARDILVVDKQFLAAGITGFSACVRRHYSTPETCRIS